MALRLSRRNWGDASTEVARVAWRSSFRWIAEVAGSAGSDSGAASGEFGRWGRG